jgi:hypothetical protein
MSDNSFLKFGIRISGCAAQAAPAAADPAATDQESNDPQCMLWQTFSIR